MKAFASVKRPSPVPRIQHHPQPVRACGGSGQPGGRIDVRGKSRPDLPEIILVFPMVRGDDIAREPVRQHVGGSARGIVAFPRNDGNPCGKDGRCQHRRGHGKNGDEREQVGKNPARPSEKRIQPGAGEQGKPRQAIDHRARARVRITLDERGQGGAGHRHEDHRHQAAPPAFPPMRRACYRGERQDAAQPGPHKIIKDAQRVPRRTRPAA